MIGWDEILEGGLPPNATVMSWRGTIGGIEASRRGHDVVMTPYSHLYFDYYQSEDQDAEPFAIGGFLPLDTVYSYEPVPPQLRDRDKARIIGAQGNVWTEYMKTGDHVEYMLLPRMLALSEVVGELERLGKQAIGVAAANEDEQVGQRGERPDPRSVIVGEREATGSWGCRPALRAERRTAPERRGGTRDARRREARPE